MLAFGVGGSVLFIDVKSLGLRVGDIAVVFKGLGRKGERGGGEMKSEFEVFICRGNGGCGLDDMLALYVVEGRDRIDASSCGVGGACDIRRPICTVAEDAIDESLLWPGRDPGPKIAGGGDRSLMS